MRSSLLKLVLAAFTLFHALDAAALDFAPCADAATRPALRGSRCATTTAPLAWDGALPGDVTLFVRKFPAIGPRRGSVWLVAGGPGESGASLYPFVDILRKSFPGFDLLIPDHRGTGLSSRICPKEEAPDSPGGTALVGAEWGSCFDELAARPARARQFTMTNAARDLRRLIEDAEEASDGTPTYLYGVSYGTGLVLRTLQLGRLPLAGVVLDSLVPVETDDRWDLSRRSVVVDEVGRRVLARCDADPACAAAMGAPAETVYRRLLDKAGREPAVVAKVPGRDLKRFLGALLDLPPLRDRIPYLIRDLDRGHTDELDAVLATLPALRVQLGDFPQTPPSLPLTAIISGSEQDLRPGRSADDVRREEAALLFSSPIPSLLQSSTLPRYDRDAYFGGQPAWLPPTLVLQGTLDPKTHYDGALGHIALLRKAGPVRLVSVTDAQHFILWTASDCFVRDVATFVNGRAGADTRCTPTGR